MKKGNSSWLVGSRSTSDEANASELVQDSVQSHWQGVVKRRSFLKGISLAGATFTTGALMGKSVSGETTRGSSRLSQTDAALLRFAAAAELIEADLWQQY